MKPINAPVFGYSQSSIISSLKMSELLSENSSASVPLASQQLNFTLLGNPTNPSGGLLSRFPDLSLQSLGLEFIGATPSDTPYPAEISSIEYDGFADFPQYPINVLADPNAFMGAAYLHGSDFLQHGNTAPQLASNDAVTISPEAQAAADLLDPAD